MKNLFLHWGPGFHSKVEQNWPLSYSWWDQPYFQLEDKDSLTKLVNLAKAKVEENTTQDKKIILTAHSFGGTLALHLSNLIPEKIEEIKLIGTSTFPPRCFLNLAKFLQEKKIGTPEMSNAIANLEKNFSGNIFWELIPHITSIENFMDYYWSERSFTSRDKYHQISKSLPGLDMGTFISLTNALISQPTQVVKSNFQGKVELILGSDDPLIDLEREIEQWSKIYPQLSYKIVKTGHFPHLELNE